MKVIVTGATGFLGGALIRDLLRHGDDVTAIVRPDSTRIANLDEFKDAKNLTVSEVSIEEEFFFPEADYDTFFHLAWGGKRNDIQEQRKNITVLENCLKFAVNSGCRRFLCTGSQAEYGETTERITEKTLLNPVNAYGLTKVKAYEIAKGVLEGTSTDLIWARVFSVFGEHDNKNTLYSSLVRALTNGTKFMLATDGTHTWNYLHESDAARALRLLSGQSIPSGVYNVASKISKPLRDYTEAIKNQIAPDSIIVYGNEKCKVNLNVDTSKLRQTIGEFEKYVF